MNDVEVMTITIIASHFFYGNVENARLMLKEFEFIRKMLSENQLQIDAPYS